MSIVIFGHFGGAKIKKLLKIVKNGKKRQKTAPEAFFTKVQKDASGQGLQKVTL